MMPLAPHMSLPPISHITANTNSSSKPKLAFSIDSIVGHNNSAANDNVSKTHISDRKDKPMPSSAIVHRNSPQIKSPHNNSPLQPQPASPQSQSQPPQQHNPQLSKRLQILSPQISPHNQIRAESGNSHTNINNNNRNNISPLSTPSPLTAQYMNGAMQYSSPQISSNHHHLHEHPLASMQSPVTGAQSQISAHTLMMAAAAHHMPTVPQDYHHAVALYPYLFRAHPFVNRFHGMPFEGGIPSFLLPPFRKPKRIRTAFSPGQLLKLEQAFEKNHYVVGNERKQLASNLGLSETQVKVWFQNRRTKHKRQKQEEDEQTPNNNSTNSAKDCHFDKMKSCRDSINTDDDDDDMVDEEDIDLEDEDSSREMMSESMRNEHIWHQSMPITTTSSATAPQIMFASTSHSNTPLL